MLTDRITSELTLTRSFIMNKIYSQKHPYHILTPSCFPTTTGTSIGWFLAIPALLLCEYIFLNSILFEWGFLSTPLVAAPQSVFQRLVDRLTPRLLKEKGILIWLITLILGSLSIPIAYRGGLGNYACFYCFPVLFGFWFFFLLYCGYCEQKLAFDTIWHEFVKMYRTVPEFQTLFVIKFLSDVFIFNALANSLFAPYVTYPLLMCWLATFISGATYSYINAALAFWFLTWVFTSGSFIIVVVKLLPKTLDWIFTYFDRTNLCLIIGNHPGSNITRTAFKIAGAATFMVGAPTLIGLAADNHMVRFYDGRFNNWYDTYTERNGHRPPESLVNERQRKTDELIQQSLVLPKLSNLVQSVAGGQGPLPK